MKWEGHEESSNLEDRRGLGKKGLAIGGGAAVLVLIVGALLGIDPQALNKFIGNNPGAQQGDNQVQERPLTPEEERSRKFAATILGFTEQVWDEQFRKAGEQYEKPHMVLFSKQV